MRLLAAVPVKRFGVAKARLAPVLGTAARARLGRAIAARTAAAAAAAGATATIVTGDDEVAAWAHRRGFEVLIERAPGLDAAAAAAVASARRQGVAWAVLHGDLPLVEPADLEPAFAAATQGVVMAPAVDGGTNLLAAALDHFAFGYGPASFHLHLRRAAPHPVTIIARVGLALDLDTPADLFRAARVPGGAWLHPYLGGAPA